MGSAIVERPLLSSFTKVKNSVENVALKKRPAQESMPKQEVVDTTSSREDLEYVRRTKEGDANAFRVLVEKYQDKARAIAFSVLANKDDAEDVAQEAFMKVFRNLESFRGQSSFYTWFYRVVFNLSIDFSRKKYRSSEIGVEEESALESMSFESNGSHSSNLSGIVSGPDRYYQRKELDGAIRRALGQLSVEHRTVIMLREIDGLSYEEISDVVGCSKGTVMSRLHHARKKLQKLLKDFSVNPE